VEVFSIGFGNGLFGFRRVTRLPREPAALGGYVKMAGELGGDGTIPSPPSANEGRTDEAPASSVPHRSAKDRGDLNGKPRWQRIAIALAGPFSNFILALLFDAGLFMMHNEVELFASQPANIDFVKQDTPPAAPACSGDRITRFDSVVNPTWEQVSTRSALSMGQTVPLTVERSGQSC